MKIGMRKISAKGRVSSRISPKRNVVHRLGMKMPKGLGVARNPKKAIYNKIYNKTSMSADKVILGSKKKSKKNYTNVREDARKLVLNKKYSEAEKLYLEIIKEEPTQDDWKKLTQLYYVYIKDYKKALWSVEEQEKFGKLNFLAKQIKKDCLKKTKK